MLCFTEKDNKKDSSNNDIFVLACDNEDIDTLCYALSIVSNDLKNTSSPYAIPTSALYNQLVYLVNHRR